ncbi:MAG: 2-hydroxycarboxylate transporter family protein [Caulobacterales bacterium]
MAERAEPAADAPSSPPPSPWMRFADFRIGIVPAPVFLVLIGLIAAFVASGKPPSDLMMMIAVLAAGGFACAEIGKRLPGLNQVGAPAILATFAPSYLVYAHLLPATLVSAVKDFTQWSNLLYLFIAAIIVGSILAMDRRVLIAGFLKIFVPLAAGSIAAAAVGTLVGAALGLGVRHSLFFVVAPIMAGGVGEGAIPLSAGYALIQHRPTGEIFAQLLPPVMLGSLTAILLSGALNYLGKRAPRLTGEGRLQPGARDLSPAEEDKAGEGAGVTDAAAALVTAVMLYLAGALAQRLWAWPAPVVMLALAVGLKLVQAAPPSLERGAFAIQHFFSTAVTYPLLFAIGVALTPWDKLVAAFNPAEVVTIVATVITLMATGFATAFAVRMYPIDVAIVNACHSGQGGTGDVAILTAANRMSLMPFAQIATRIGGAITVTLCLLALARFGPHLP